MTQQLSDLTILLPPLLAGMLILSLHVPFGFSVLKRKIVFLDLAVAQMASLGAVIGPLVFHSQAESGWLVQLVATITALAGAVLLGFFSRATVVVQEAVIGISFVLSASMALLLLSHDPHGAESIEYVLSGQLLWVNNAQLQMMAVVYALLIVGGLLFPASWKNWLFYPSFAIVITQSVQVAGVYLVFASLIIPSLIGSLFERYRYLVSYSLGIAGYLLGLLFSYLLDLPAGPTIVVLLTLLAGLVAIIKSLSGGNIIRQ